MAAVKQHLIDPEICIRCHTCEEACTVGAISHNDDNVVVDVDKCNFCMDCIAPCPTGSIDNWRVVKTPYTLAEQFEMLELPEQAELGSGGQSGDSQDDTPIEAFESDVEALLAEAHKGAGGKTLAPASAAKPTINLFSASAPLQATVQGNFRLTDVEGDSDVRHIILDLGSAIFPVLEGQSVAIIPPGKTASGKAHAPRLYSVSSPRDGERPNTNNLSLTIKREEGGVCSNYVCDLARGETLEIFGPFGATFLMPEDPKARLLMICTGTGSAPFRGFTMRSQRVAPDLKDRMKLFFGARQPNSLPYFGPLNKIPTDFLDTHFAFSRMKDAPKTYVQDKIRMAGNDLAQWLSDENCYIFVCGLKAMEIGVETALADIARAAGLNWQEIRDKMRSEGRYHVETY